jgi:hypothetical protein
MPNTNSTWVLSSSTIQVPGITPVSPFVPLVLRAFLKERCAIIILKNLSGIYKNAQLGLHSDLNELSNELFHTKTELQYKDIMV